MRRIAALILFTGLAGCVQTVAPPPVATPAPTPVVAAPRPVVSVPANPAPTTPVVAVPAPDPARPAAVAVGPRDARTGLPQSSLVSVAGDASSRFTVLFRPNQADAASISAAPARLCGASGVANTRTQAPRAGSAMPGVQILVVECGAV
ncbi:MAG: hypothetical protein Q4G14_14100 [Paracoccus sp. (in: a-proteobacteria)]|uniref:hypothetical protein n=1 Tax=Paracoccus sp. TaxID=267 RepID=UPI0026E10F4A|nr:hypothetical protein [Paracoccus sp. (in: a-proteobacteria)]MDO5614359.1 hypothetical protein [Paracoccus sp. (in: a-proteobacteria)]